MKPYSKIPTAFARDPQTHKVNVGRIKSPAIRNVKLWSATEKLDGTNIRIILNAGFGGEARVTYHGRTNNAAVPGDLMQLLMETYTGAKLGEHFVDGGFIGPGDVATLYGEGVGPGIQKGGARYGEHKHFVLFDVKIGDGPFGWLDDDDVDEIAKAVGAPRAPRLDHCLETKRAPGPITFDEACGLVRYGIPSAYGEGQAEGAILRPWHEPLYDRRGRRVIAKIKHVDF